MSNGFSSGVGNSKNLLTTSTTWIPLLAFFVEMQLGGGDTLRAQHIVFNLLILTCVTYMLISRRRLLTLRADRLTLTLAILASISVINTYYEAGRLTEEALSHFLTLLIIPAFCGDKEDRAHNELWFFLVILLIALAQAFLGIAQFCNIIPANNVRLGLTGSFYNSGPWAIMLSLGANIALTFALFPRPGIFPTVSKILFPIAFGILALLCYVSGSRTSWLVLLVGCVFAIAVKYRTPISPKFRNVGVAGTFSLFAILGYVIFTYKAASSYGRLKLWLVILSSANDFVLSGVGVGRFGNVIGKYLMGFNEQYGTTFLSGSKLEDVRYAFNDYLQVMVEQGLIVFIVVLMLVGLVLRKAKTESDMITRLIFNYMSLISLLVACMFSYPLEFPGFFYILVFSLVSIYSEVGNDGKRIRATWPFLIIFFSGAIFLGFQNVKMFQARLNWQKAETLAGDGLYFRAIDLMKESYEGLEQDPEYMASLGKLYLLSGQSAEAAKLLRLASETLFDPVVFNNLAEALAELRDFSQSEKCLSISEKISPGSIYNHYLMVKLCMLRQDKKRAFLLAQQILQRQYPASQMTQQVKSELLVLIGELNE